MITYPVDTENTRWSIWSIADQEIKTHNKPWPRGDGQEIVGLNPDLVPLLEVNEDRPVFDSAIQKLEVFATVNVNANTHTHGWNIVPLSQAELDEIAAEEQAILDREASRLIDDAEIA